MTAKNKNESRSIEILSVRANRSRLAISWMEGKDKHTVDFHEAPLPAFLKSIRALGTHAVALCELPSKDVDKVVATGITCREKGDNTLALITVKKKVRKGKRAYPFSTPLLPMYEDAENPGADHMEEEERKAIEKVVREAEKYILGERAQGEFKFEDGDEEPEEKPKGDPGANTEALPFKSEEGAPTNP